ncbi:STAS domain-containing protein [Uliginosibacterium sp. 31-16]|uniref:STAS domain-containing protein n=1 Tax=Uliginosibacterium sp. 31-16 TaxID=3068315 RepID=UPI00273E84CD|nr:STAS domain-containing protein [Uliginosibacterium sp. 31-16]MDP5238881.1 STAS domain-containing protein [Uliginosibacterium sp. 31-16]
MLVQPMIVPEELTVHHVRTLAPRLIEAARSGERLNLDLSAVSHIDTAGIQLLLTVRREANSALTQLEFANPSAVVSEMVSFYQLDGLLQAHAPLLPV